MMDKVERISKTEKTKGKLKKRNVSKSKKPNAKRQKDSTHLSQQGLANPENRRACDDRRVPVVGLSKSKHPPALSSANSNNKQGCLHSSRAKVSETVTTRKVLGSLQLHPNTDQAGNSGDQLQIDLQRVLGKPDSSFPASSDCHAAPAPPPSAFHPPPHRSFGANTFGVAMEMSPGLVASSSVAVAQISKPILEGLQVDVIFPHSTYLQNSKDELRKIFKERNASILKSESIQYDSLVQRCPCSLPQQKGFQKQHNPCGYEELVGYFSASSQNFPLPPPPPPLMFAQHLTETITASYSEQEDHQELQDGIRGTKVTTVERMVVITGRSNVGDHLPNNSLPSAADHLTPGHVTDLVALNLEVNTSALNINDRLSPKEDHNLLRPRDFLDLLDSVPPVGGPRSPSPDWSNTPERPRLFPHKLH